MASNHPISLPIDIADLTPEWLDAALRSWTPGIRLKHSEIVDINHGTCTKIRMALELRWVRHACREDSGSPSPNGATVTNRV